MNRVSGFAGTVRAMTDAIRSERERAVSIVRMDDGKANAISMELLAGLNAALDEAEKEGGAVALLGRPGRFSAGFDLATFSKGPEATRDLLGGGAELLVRMLEYPLPIVAGCTGHALAMGSLILLASDLRIGAEGDFKIGLNEVAIKMVLPQFAVKLARERLSKRHLLRATTMAEIYGPSGAVDAGYLDRAVSADALEAAVLSEAARLAELPRSAFAGTKRNLRGEVAADIAAGLADDLGQFAAGSA